MKNIGIIGGGLIGSSWAAIFSKSGFNVFVYDPYPEVFNGYEERVTLFLQELNKYKYFFENLVLNDMEIPSWEFRCTKHKKGDFLESHTDDTGERLLSFVYHHTKNWKSGCGGELAYVGSFGEISMPPKYNTLYIFIPSARSHHRIKNVICGTRYTITGWGIVKDSGLSLQLLKKIMMSTKL